MATTTINRRTDKRMSLEQSASGRWRFAMWFLFFFSERYDEIQLLGGGWQYWGSFLLPLNCDWVLVSIFEIKKDLPSSSTRIGTYTHFGGIRKTIVSDLLRVQREMFKCKYIAVSKVLILCCEIPVKTEAGSDLSKGWLPWLDGEGIQKLQEVISDMLRNRVLYFMAPFAWYFTNINFSIAFWHHWMVVERRKAQRR